MPSSARTVGVLAGVLALAAAPAASRAEPEHLVYLEALGKGGAWGLGYEHRLSARLAAGAAASATWIGDERFLSLSPYVGAGGGRGRHGWFVQLGPQVVHHRVVSPVPEWEGERHTGTAGQLTTGWEVRFASRWLARVSATVIAGQGGVAPWGGVALGARL